MTPSMAATSASSSDGLRRFTRQWLLILTFAVLGVAAAVGFAALQHKRYTATASLSFNDSSQDVSILGSVPTENLQPTEQVNAAAETIKRTQVLTRVQRQLRGALSLSQLRGDVQATTNPESDLVQVTATTGGAALSAQAANAVANQAVAVTNGQTRAQYASAAHKLRAQLAGLGHGPGSAAARAELADAIGRLESLSLLATPGQIAEPARIPTSPSSPMPVLDGLIGGVVGMLIGLFAAMLRDSVDTRLRSSAQIKQVADLPVLGRVRGDSLGHVAGAGADDGQALGLESFRILRTNLEFLARDAPVKTILVTSAVAEEGKTTVASSLAYASAMVGKSTLLVDCDLRHPTVASRLGIEGRPGFTDCLTGRADRADVVRPVAVAGSENGAYAGLQIQPLYCPAGHHGGHGGGGVRPVLLQRQRQAPARPQASPAGVTSRAFSGVRRSAGWPASVHQDVAVVETGAVKPVQRQTGQIDDQTQAHPDGQQRHHQHPSASALGQRVVRPAQQQRSHRAAHAAVRAHADDLQTVAQQHRQAVAREATVVMGRVVLAGDERHRDDRLTPRAQRSDELGQRHIKVGDVLEHLRAQHGIKLPLPHRPRLSRGDHGVHLGSREHVDAVVAGDPRHPGAVRLVAAAHVQQRAPQGLQQRAQLRVQRYAEEPLVVPWPQVRRLAGDRHVPTMKQAAAVWRQVSRRRQSVELPRAS